MSFNKSKAMKSAERFLTQGKLHSAISEYKIIVENDPKDINTMNMLGDLYVKCDDNKSATDYYRQVAKHYHKLGFAKKAISIYNKIYRIDPESLEIAEKLAELYKSRGSVAEAIKHYVDIAKKYKENGLREKALDVWEILGELDPQNSDIYIKIAEYYWQDDQKENASDSFIEAAVRLLAKAEYEAAVTSFSRALEISPDNLAAVNGLVKSQLQMGYPEEAAKTLEQLAEKDQFNKEVAYLLIDCYFDLDQPEKAEEVIIKIIEREPANYGKLIDLVDIYLEKDDLESTVRILSMIAEHFLIDGKNEELKGYIEEVLARNPEQIQALRMLARFYGWQKDELELQKTLERLVETAHTLESFEDERYALEQLNFLVPHNVTFAERLKEINENYDFEDEIVSENLLHKELNKIPSFDEFEEDYNDETEDESVREYNSETDDYEPENEFSDSEIDVLENDFGEDNSEEVNIHTENIEIAEFESHNAEVEKDLTSNDESSDLTLANEQEIEDEVESVKFYIEQGYIGLAEKSLESLEGKFGKQAVFTELREQIGGDSAEINEESKDSDSEEIVEISDGSIVEEFEESAKEQQLSAENETIIDEFVENQIQISENDFEKENVCENLPDDLDLENKTENTNEDDYENHYHYAVAYQEMGLLEEAIREFQDAANCVRVNDGTRRFYQCSNLLGHCFMEQQMPHLALEWLEKALETNDLSDAEKQGLQYELANAYEANGELDEARKNFEEVYDSDADYRDVGKRVKNLEQQLVTQ